MKAKFNMVIKLLGVNKPYSVFETGFKFIRSPNFDASYGAPHSLNWYEKHKFH